MCYIPKQFEESVFSCVGLAPDFSSHISCGAKNLVRLLAKFPILQVVSVYLFLLFLVVSIIARLQSKRFVRDR